MAGDAPAERRVLAMRSMETKLVMHWMRGDWVLTVERWAQAVGPHSGEVCWCFTWWVLSTMAVCRTRMKKISA